jgi:hypothetical protein
VLDKSQELDSKMWWWNKVDYKKEVERLKVWWRNRIAYLDEEINKL